MAEGFKNTFITFIIAGLFVFALISFVVIFERDNAINDGIINNSVINSTYVDLNDRISSGEADINNQNVVQDAESPTISSGDFNLFSIIGLGKTAKGIVVGVYNVIIVIPSRLLGVPQIVISTLTIILIITLILFAWRLIKQGE
jgi:hypothetical protein